MPEETTTDKTTDAETASPAKKPNWLQKTLQRMLDLMLHPEEGPKWWPKICAFFSLVKEAVDWAQEGYRRLSKWAFRLFWKDPGYSPEEVARELDLQKRWG